MLQAYNLVSNLTIACVVYVEDDWLYVFHAGYCCLLCPSPVVSIIGPFAPGFVLLLIRESEEEEEETKAGSGCAAGRDLPHHLA